MAVVSPLLTGSPVSLRDSLDAVRGWFNAHAKRPRLIAIQSAT
jgi:hypothetical protein